MRTKILRAILLGALSATAALPGCATEPGDSAQPETTGEIGLEVKLAPGLTLDSVSYTITGPVGFSRTGSIDVGNSTTVSAIVSRIPFGAGYQITMRGASSDGSAVCMGTATFDVDGPGTKPVALHMTCELQPTTGSILINGSLNICPRIEGIDVSPAEVIFGGAISLQAAASDLDRAPAPLGFSWTATSGTISNALTTGPTWTCNKVGRTTLTFAASDGDPACASSRSVDVVCSEPPSETPIKHVIVLIGENRTFDHTFGTYVPVPGQTVANLVSKGIVNPDGTPGPNFALAAQSEAAAQGAYYIAPDSKTRYAVLPGPSTSGAPSAQRTTAPPFQTIDQARAETDMAPEDLGLLTTGATGLPARVLDTRVSNAGALPDGPFQLTGPSMPYDAYTGDTIHRFYQMWQQFDCSAAQATPDNPSGCLGDLFPFVAISFSTADNGVGSSMAFFNVNNGDVPLFKALADNFAMSDNMHQPCRVAPAPTTRCSASATRWRGPMAWATRSCRRPA